MFVDIECASSFYLFDKENCLRVGAYRIYKHKYFEKVVQVLIFLSSFKLAFDTYLLDYDETTQI